MKYKINEIKNREKWDYFVLSQSNHTFLHSWSWGKFNVAMGDNIWRFGVCGGGKLIAVALVIKVHARRGNFLFIPQGPIFRSSFAQGYGGQAVFKIFLEKFKEIAKKESVNFIRISPLLEDTKENRKMFKGLGFKSAPIHMHAEALWVLSLKPSEEELLKGMRKNTRNLIRRAAREGVIVKRGVKKKTMKAFKKLYEETANRHKFTPFGLTYIKNQYKIFKESNEIEMFTACYKNEPVASAIVVFYGNSAFYHHGASSQKYPKIPAAQLLQWEAIKEAKKRGHQFYNFWGIIRADNPRHPWAGITLFKKGFGGFQINYMRAQDFPLSICYWANWALETIRRKKRNL